ncbi:hypothetical protein Tco_0031010 [Tanacetum coccineum]
MKLILTSMCLVRECWTGLHEMAMAAFESQYIGSELTKEDRESQLYDDLEHFRQHKGETIHDYYVSFSKLINNMRNIKMTMSRMQLNSKGASIDEGGGWRWLWGSLRNRVGIVNPVDQQGRLRATTATLRRMRVALDDEQLLFLKVGHGQRQLMKIWLWRQPVQDLASMWINDHVMMKPVRRMIWTFYLRYTTMITIWDAVCEHLEEHEMHDDVQPNYVVDSHADYTSNSNMIPYDQYVKDNAVPVVQSNVSSVTNDAYMMIYNDMCEPHAQSVSKTTRNIVVDNSLTAELETYKEQVELYERRARFELTEREQKIDEQLRIVITDRNIKEENLKKELHSVKLQLASTINHNKSMVEEVTSLKKDFKQKENKYLEGEIFLDMKALNRKGFGG